MNEWMRRCGWGDYHHHPLCLLKQTVVLFLYFLTLHFAVLADGIYYSVVGRQPAAGRQKSKVFTLREFSNIMINYIYVRMSVVYVVCALSHLPFWKIMHCPLYCLVFLFILSLSTLLCECAREHIQILPSIHVSSRPCSKAIHQIR